MRWVEKVIAMEIHIISLADTIGIADPKIISMLFKDLIPQFSRNTAAQANIEFGAHLHTTPDTWREKIEAAYENGCRRFDGAIKGFGGCPMAADELTGNMPTENLISFFEEKKIEPGINKDAFRKVMLEAEKVFA
jgi:hydroxymethylglutaryl-CoA lyase